MGLKSTARKARDTEASERTLDLSHERQPEDSLNHTLSFHTPGTEFLNQNAGSSCCSVEYSFLNIEAIIVTCKDLF